MFYLDLHKMTEMQMAFQFTKSYAFKILILEKRLKAHFNFLSKVHSVFHHYLFPQDNLSHPTFPLAKSIVRMNQNLNFE